MRKRKELKFCSYKPEYGTKIVKDVRTGRLISPARPEEVFTRKHKFTSKGLGLMRLANIAKATKGAEFLHFHYLPHKKAQALGKGELRKLLTNPNALRILVRSDNAKFNSIIGMRERISQPRAVFPNTPKGKREAAALIRDLNPHYGVIIQHPTRNIKDVLSHGRLFVNAKTGTVWLFSAKRDPKTDTFVRWDHKLVTKNSKDRAKKGDGSMNTQAREASLAVAERIKAQIAPTYKDIVSAAFVTYKGEATVPEFYDLLYIHGMKRPGFRSF
jgi:hypothetical protein